MSPRTKLQTTIVTFGLLALAGTGCSDGDKGAQAQLAQLCSMLDAKQAELDCKVAALNIKCSDGDTACINNKSAQLAACDTPGAGGSTSSSTSTATSTSGFVRPSACGGPAPAVSSSSSTSTDTSTSTSSSTSTTTATN